jgi:hypothetical protein
VSVTVDTIDYPRWRVSGAASIEIDIDIDDHQIRVAFAGGSNQETSVPMRGRKTVSR